MNVQEPRGKRPRGKTKRQPLPLTSSVLCGRVHAVCLHVCMYVCMCVTALFYGGKYPPKHLDRVLMHASNEGLDFSFIVRYRTLSLATSIIIAKTLTFFKPNFQHIKITSIFRLFQGSLVFPRRSMVANAAFSFRFFCSAMRMLMLPRGETRSAHIHSLHGEHDLPPFSPAASYVQTTKKNLLLYSICSLAQRLGIICLYSSNLWPRKTKK